MPTADSFQQRTSSFNKYYRKFGVYGSSLLWLYQIAVISPLNFKQQDLLWLKLF